MLFTLEPLPASEGDCLLLHWGTAAAPKLAVIDGGPRGTYEKQLRPRLVAYRDASAKASVSIELIMVSHIDNDHIVGIGSLFAEARKDLDASKPSAFTLKRLWHNTFNDVLGDGVDQYYKELTTSFQASVADAPNPVIVDRLREALEGQAGTDPIDAQHAAHDISLVLAGHADGRQLRDDHRALLVGHRTATLNSPFVDANNKPTLVAAGHPAAVPIAGLELLAVGPMQPELKKLQAAFDKFIKDNGLTAEAVLAAYADTSIPNLSSIVCLASFGDGKSKATILFTGDARGDKILKGLESAGLLGHEPLQVDILKVPHHGSERNVELEFFERVVARVYVLSGNGKYGNPDQQTLKWITGARGKGKDYDIYLTYPVEDIDKTRKEYFAAHGMQWSNARHSLAPFLKKRREQGYKFGLHAGAPVQIELGDEATPW